MTQTAAPNPAETPAARDMLSAVHHRAVYLVGLCQGADILFDDLNFEPNDASNAMVPLLHVIQEKAQEVVNMLEAMGPALRPAQPKDGLSHDQPAMMQAEATGN
jgi:hypothetical protein